MEITFNDSSTEAHLFTSFLVGYVIGVTVYQPLATATVVVDIMVTGTGMDDGWMTVTGNEYDHETGEGDPTKPWEFKLTDIQSIEVY